MRKRITLDDLRGVQARLERMQGQWRRDEKWLISTFGEFDPGLADDITEMQRNHSTAIAHGRGVVVLSYECLRRAMTKKVSNANG